VKRSAAVPLTLVTTLSAGALAAAACGPRAEAMQCVDKTTQRAVPDSVCANAGVSPSAATAAGPAAAPGDTAAVRRGGFPVGGLFAWYYGGRIVQGLVRGGSYAPVAGRAYRSSSGFVAGPAARGAFGAARQGTARQGAPARSGVSRGGFGATGAGRVGGG
jgi:hypothetical protein